MEKVVAYADVRKIDLILHVLRFQYTSGLDNHQLKSFYKRFGFVVIDSKPPVVMYRPHSRELHAS